MVSWQAHASSDIDWIHFKAKFLMQDGRVLDTGNGSVSHSEGQGYGMLFAVAANDKQSFQRIWNWTKQSLQNPNLNSFIGNLTQSFPSHWKIKIMRQMAIF